MLLIGLSVARNVSETGVKSVPPVLAARAADASASVAFIGIPVGVSAWDGVVVQGWTLRAVSLTVFGGRPHLFHGSWKGAQRGEVLAFLKPLGVKSSEESDAAGDAGRGGRGADGRTT